jgi:hypothetical protein
MTTNGAAMPKGFYLVYQSIIERLRKGSVDYDAFILELVDQGVDEPDARRMVQIAKDQIAQEQQNTKK